MSEAAQLRAEALYPAHLYPENENGRQTLIMGYIAGFDAAKADAQFLAAEAFDEGAEYMDLPYGKRVSAKAAARHNPYRVDKH